MHLHNRFLKGHEDVLKAAADEKCCPMFHNNDILGAAKRRVLSLLIQMICGPVLLAVMDCHFIMQAKHSLRSEPAGGETTA